MAKKFFIRPKSKAYKPMTLGEEVDSLVTEWYKDRGMPVPAEDLVGKEIDAAEAAEAARLDAIWEKEAGRIPAVAPAYGTPEFWEYHRAKKAAENARRAEEGLPPLPTKKELEAEKEKKRAAKAAEKAAKETTKAANAATKAANAATKAANATTKAAKAKPQAS